MVVAVITYSGIGWVYAYADNQWTHTIGSDMGLQFSSGVGKAFSLSSNGKRKLLFGHLVQIKVMHMFECTLMMKFNGIKTKQTFVIQILFFAPQSRSHFKKKARLLQLHIMMVLSFIRLIVQFISSNTNVCLVNCFDGVLFSSGNRSCI